MDSYIGQIILFAGNFAPEGWLACDGTMLNISQNQALFSIIGTFYGGDGKTTFALPDLGARVPVGIGTYHNPTDPTDKLVPVVALGQKGGSNTASINATPLTGKVNATLTAANIPALTSSVSIPTVNAGGNTDDPSNANLAKLTTTSPDTVNIYSNGATSTHLNPFNITVGNPTPTPISVDVSISTTSVTLDNRQPYLGLLYIICVRDGIYPIRPQ